MRDLIVVEFMSLDGVVQAPGDPSEDPDGFEHGGWTRPFFADHRRYIHVSYRTAGALLFGRKTYDIFAAYWPTVTDADDEIASALNTLPKYVASTTLVEGQWQPTIVIRGDVAAQVASLKKQPGKDILVVGSSQLAHTLIRHDLVDEYQLWLHPVVLGSGKRLFPDRDAATTMRLVDAQTTASGVVILTYQPAPADAATSTQMAS